MKKSSATIYSPAMELPFIINKRTIRRNRRRIGKEAEPAEPVNHIVQPPDEALIAELNRIGQEYPFCVCFKAKMYDPL
ncbi:MAG TPA: hypothetical protein VIM79_18020 [Niastella sp.]